MSTHSEDLPGSESTPPQQPVPAASTRKSTGSRTGRAWDGLVVGIVILVVLLIFILQNLETIQVSLFFWDFGLPTGVAVLLSALGGALVMALVGGARIIQLRRVAKR
ncbi:MULTISPECIES: LapA family protein [Nocardia]|uniref:Lipopolysaccharide assembly protein LapA domain-containing protein n=1 Tax=Nocardia aurea TaxID=2144174 RepID=A0ABV3FTL2_9NOCA|nr:MULTISPECIES: lipopolysaccharide assembly protein LapA domain-containing protein [Nocardia]